MGGSGEISEAPAAHDAATSSPLTGEKPHGTRGSSLSPAAPPRQRLGLHMGLSPAGPSWCSQPVMDGDSQRNRDEPAMLLQSPAHESRQQQPPTREGGGAEPPPQHGAQVASLLSFPGPTEAHLSKLGVWQAGGHEDSASHGPPTGERRAGVAPEGLSTGHTLSPKPSSSEPPAPGAQRRGLQAGDTQ